MREANLSCYPLRDVRGWMIALEGALDVATAGHALNCIQQFLLDRGPSITIDASRLNFIDSKGVGTLISAARMARDVGGTLYLHEAALPVQKILETCGVAALFPAPPEPPASAPKPPAEATSAGTAEPPPARRAAARPRERMNG